MDGIEVLIPLLGVVFVMGPIASLVFSYTPIGRAVVDRIRGRTGGRDDRALVELQDEVERLHEYVANQEHRFEELHDRLDFAERLLARGSQTPDHAEGVATPE